MADAISASVVSRVVRPSDSSPRKSPRSGSTLWYSRSRLVNQASSQFNPLFFGKGFERPEFGDPIDPPDQLRTVVAQEPKRFLPLTQNPVCLLILFPQLFGGRLTVEPLQIKRRHMLPSSNRTATFK